MTRIILLMNEFSTPVTQELDERQIPYRVFRHPGPVTSLEQAARERGQEPQQVIRSLLFRLSADNFVLALMAGLDRPSAGEVWLNGERIDHLSEDRLAVLNPTATGDRLRPGQDPGGGNRQGWPPQDPEPGRTAAEPAHRRADPGTGIGEQG